MKKTFIMAAVLAILVISIAPTLANAQVAQGKEAPGKASSKAMTDTELKQAALKEFTLTDTWLAANGYSRALKDEVLKKSMFYEKDGLYYIQKSNKFMPAEKVPGIEISVILQMNAINKRNKK